MPPARNAPESGGGRRARRARVQRAASQVNRAKRRRTLQVVAAVAVLVMAFGGIVLFQQISQVQQGAVTPNVPEGQQLSPELRARGAVLTIAGDDSRPDVTFDPSTGMITARFQSKYYNLQHSATCNRQYLATEGRLVVQMALHNSPEAAGVNAVLYRGSQELATITGTSQEEYAGYRVQYAAGLPPGHPGDKPCPP